VHDGGPPATRAGMPACSRCSTSQGTIVASGTPTATSSAPYRPPKEASARSTAAAWFRRCVGHLDLLAAKLDGRLAPRLRVHAAVLVEPVGEVRGSHHQHGDPVRRLVEELALHAVESAVPQG